jgi:hypothetical protein
MAIDPGPGYWMYEIGGMLRPAVEAYLKGRELTPQQIAALRAYCRQWIMAGVWDENPHAGPEEWVWLAKMRRDIDRLTDQAALSSWLRRATEGGLDPL